MKSIAKPLVHMIIFYHLLVDTITKVDLIGVNYTFTAATIYSSKILIVNETYCGAQLTLGQPYGQHLTVLRTGILYPVTNSGPYYFSKSSISIH